MMLRFQKRAPSSLHTTRKVAQKDPIFPPRDNPNLSSQTTTRCKRNINLQQYKNSHSNLLYKTNLPFDLWLEEGDK